MNIKNSQQLSVILTTEQLRNFSSYVKEVTNSDISELTAEKLGKLYDDFEIGELASDLCDKVNAEYSEFIEDMKNHSAEYIIDSAYEIVWKDNITQFMDTSEYSFPYIASWSNGRQLAQLKTALREIQSAAKLIGDEIEAEVENKSIRMACGESPYNEYLVG